MMEFDWKIICVLTDQTILGTDGLSCKPPKRKSRAILVNEDDEIAVMYEKASDFYALPGGGIEQGEDAEAALVREIAEETGCACDAVEPLGVVFENRAHADTTYLSYFFVVHTKGKQGAPRLTDEENALGTMMKWCPLEEVLLLIQRNPIDTNQKKFLQARDLAALQAYIHLYTAQ